jgi:hypothetical protein
MDPTEIADNVTSSLPVRSLSAGTSDLTDATVNPEESFVESLLPSPNRRGDASSSPQSYSDGAPWAHALEPVAIENIPLSPAAEPVGSPK